MKVICDIDGTIANNDHRAHYAEAEQWDAFHGRCLDDTPIASIIQILCTFAFCGHTIELWTGRDEKFRELTEIWLSKHAVPFDELRMRPEKDARSVLMVKHEWAAGVDPATVLCVLEDDPRNVEMFRERGFTCLQVQQ